jgi:hypothetical protein
MYDLSGRWGRWGHHGPILSPRERTDMDEDPDDATHTRLRDANERYANTIKSLRAGVREALRLLESHETQMAGAALRAVLKDSQEHS